MHPFNIIAKLSVIFCLCFAFAGEKLQAANPKSTSKTVLKIAVDTTYPPMEFESLDGKIVGFDVDLATELAKRMGLNAEFVVMSWDGILAGLSSKRYDIIMSSMTVTEDRKKQVDFVEYIQMGQVFVGKKGQPPVKTEKDLSGKVVAVQADTTSFEAVEGFKKSGIAVKEIKAFKGATDTFAALKSGQADVIVIDEPVGRYYVKQDKMFVVTGEALKPEPIGVAIRKDDKELRFNLTKKLQEIKKDGTFSKLSVKWFDKELGK